MIGGILVLFTGVGFLTGDENNMVLTKCSSADAHAEWQYSSSDHTLKNYGRDFCLAAAKFQKTGSMGVALYKCEDAKDYNGGSQEGSDSGRWGRWKFVLKDKMSAAPRVCVGIWAVALLIVGACAVW